ncbi:regulatory CAT8 [Fusarium sp. NRRL 25303]|nr:regulatory CAT8 [Fusarium sp. NRRL 25303]
MNYPPLFPRAPTHLSNEAIPTPAPKRRAVAVACDSCRGRKVRCTGEFPTCVACQRRGGECRYADIANDREMHSNQLKRRVKELEDENRGFRTLFETFRRPVGRTNQEILQRIQAGDDFGTVIERAQDLGYKRKRNRSPSPSLMARQRQSEWTTFRGILPETPIASPAVYPIVLPIPASPSLPPLPLPPTDTPSSPKDAILGLLTLSQDKKPDLVLLNEARPKEHCDLRLNDLSVSFWTRVPISNRSASTLISTFLETDNSAVGFIDKDLFLTDLVQHNPTFCSAFLVNSILYLACFAHTASDGRAATLAHSFFNDGERLYRAERLSDSLTTLAAINIFSLGSPSDGSVIARYAKFRSKTLSTSSWKFTVVIDYVFEHLTFPPESPPSEVFPLISVLYRSHINTMASSPETTASSVSTPHHTLPFDVEIMIVNELIELYNSTDKRLAPLATVSETWQRIVEKHTFQDLRLSERDLLAFERGYQMNIEPTNLELLGLISRAADHLEHIAVSYAFSANHFVDHCKGIEFKRLKTLALTYRFNGIPHIGLLENASEAVKRMPALEMLEIWEFGLPGPQAHIFRLPDCIYGASAWMNKSTGGKVHVLEVVEDRFARHDVITFSDLVPHLRLKGQILRESTMKQVLELIK